MHAISFKDESRRDLGERQAWRDTLDRRIDHLRRNAIRQAGYADELARHAELAWRSTGLWPVTDPARDYEVSRRFRRFQRLHVGISWRDPGGRLIAVPGPIVIGAGRYVGLGLFAASD